MGKISVIATTYNQPKDLYLYLRTLGAQKFADFDVFLADDGSGPETKEVIEKAKSDLFGDRLHHIWHSDEGYRKSKILNEAIRQSTGDSIIFTDSDVILHPQFIEDHLKYVGKNQLFMGRRVDLETNISQWIRKNPERLFSPEFYIKVIASGFGSEPTQSVKRSFRITSPLFSKLMGQFRVPDLLGSNFSICRELLFKINGFDESMERYWGEDGDLFLRARNSGAHITGRKSYAVQFHLWHPRRAPQPEAEKKYQENVKDRQYQKCLNGIKTASLQ